jgi:hypothetical protein
MRSPTLIGSVRCAGDGDGDDDDDDDDEYAPGAAAFEVEPPHAAARKRTRQGHFIAP